MGEVTWIKLKVGMFDDSKIKYIEALPERDTIITIWVKLLTLAGKYNEQGYIMLAENLPYNEEMLANEFNRPLNSIRLALETFKQLKMIEMDEGAIKVTNWQKHQNIEGLEKIREQNRLRKQKQRKKEKLKAPDSHVKSRDSHATEKNRKEEDIEKNRIDKEEEVEKRENAFDFFQNNGFGYITQYNADDISYYLDSFNSDQDEIVIAALKVAKDRNKVTWGYAKAILNNWLQKNLHSIEQIRAYEKQEAEARQNSYKPKHQHSREKTPEWMNDRNQQKEEVYDPELEKARLEFERQLERDWGD